MQFQFSFQHMDTSPALQDYTEEKIREKIQKFVTKPIEAHVFFSVVRHEQRVHCSLRGGDGFNVEVEHSCNDMYGSVDHMVDKLQSQLKKQKEKLKEHKHKENVKTLPVRGPEEDDVDGEEMDAADVLKFEQARRKSTGT